jgi:protein ImuB
MVPDRPPTVLRWRGREMRIVTGIGPERIGAEWWRWRAEKRRGRAGGEAESEPERFFTRDYFRVQEDVGRWLWVYRELETGRWFVHGFWA